MARRGQQETESDGSSDIRTAACAPDRPSWWMVILIVSLALAVRIVYILETGSMPFVQQLVGDAAGYYEWAQRIAAGDWVGSESFYQAPLYPYALAVIFRTVGESVVSIRMVQAVGGAIAAGLLCMATGRTFGRRVGIVAGLMLALYPPAIFFDGIVQKASLSCVCISGLIAAALCFDTRRTFARLVLIGVLSGLVVLVRENALVWLPILALWSWLGRGQPPARRRWAQLGAYAVGVAIVLMPVGFRNLATGGSFSLSTFQAGPNFYIGNKAGATGRYAPLVRGHETPAFERRDATMLAERDLGRSLAPREVSQYWMDRAWSDIKADVPGWLRLVGFKSLLVWNRYEVSDYESQALYEDYSILLALLSPMLHFGVLVPLAGAGLIATRSHWRRLWILYSMCVLMALAVTIFYIMARYRYPLVPLLMPLAAAGLIHLWDGVRTRRVHQLWPAVATMIALAGVCNLSLVDEPRLAAMARMNLGVTVAQSGDLAQATVHLRRAVEGHPGSAEAHVNLATTLSMQGQFTEAISHYRAALQLDGDLLGVDYNLAVAFEAVGAVAEARHHYQRAVERNPDDREAKAALERLGKGLKP